MNYREFLTEAKTLSDPWPMQTGAEGEDHPSTNFYTARAKAAPLNRRGYIPTGFAKLDQLVVNTGAEFVYNVTGDPNVDGEDARWPHYSSEDDRIYLPPPESFDSVEHYARTVLHELSHWTMKALDREPIQPENSVEFGALLYGVWQGVATGAEEATAEMSAASVYAQVVPDGAVQSGHTYALHYVRGWMDNLQRMNAPKDSLQRVEQYAMEQAERAANFLLSKLEQTA